ncbi:hypothetical protein DAPPUDRAFT_302142 [Daphnia pulex]|uniref:Uncharacterized protein n=1 Tax=Daphnia pulex TaxID=6669 RepID=E9GBT5_DAPPU|nr:hypothetical protein DAPPUDRAFT_302142 [Daphnia pulex]|eukprot:EFX83016.1 hypothetical protein DAPPUDRAFT_302142 [Daphnia pulex]
MDFNNTFVIITSSSGQLDVVPALPSRSLNYFLICLAFFIFCPLFYILCRFVKLLCFPGSVPADATALSAAESDENSDIGVYVIDIDLIQGYIRNSETSSDRQSRYCFASATPRESHRLSPSQTPKTCPSYGELYDLDSPPPTYEEWESKTFLNTIPPATESTPASKAPPSFSHLQFEQLYRNLIHFAFYMFYRLKRFV